MTKVALKATDQMSQRRSPSASRKKTIRSLSPKASVFSSDLPSTRRKKSVLKVPPNGSVPSSDAPPIADDTVTQGVLPETALPIVSDLILSIRELHRQRIDLLNAEGSLARQLKSIARRGLVATDTHLTIAAPSFDASLAAPCLSQARKLLHPQKLKVERLMAERVKDLPVFASFVQPICGFGAIGLGQIVGEAGDLSLYANPAKLWKRMGLGLVNGERQRKCKDAEKALAHGYNPRRRSIMHVIGDSLIKKQNSYRELYLARKLVEEQKVPDGSKGLWHNRSLRYMEKRLLLGLWKAWRHA